MYRERIIFLYQWVTEIFLILVLPVISFLRLFIPLNRVKNHNSQKPPVIIIEQWFAKTISHMFLKKYLEERDFKVYLFTYNPINGGLDDGAYRLKQFIKNHKLHNCILVGISMGAVTSYVYAQRFGGWKRIKKLLCMAGPFQGTPWAHWFAFLKSGRQLLPGSNFIKKLKKEKMPDPTRIVCISAKSDEFVPRWSSVLSQVRNEEISVVGHNNLHIWSKQVWEMVAREAV